jgi:outer membrane lipoprotein-sorting protein
LKKIISLFIISQLLFGLTGIELAKKVEDRKSPIDMKSTMTMVLTNKKGKTRTSSIRSYSKDDSKKQILWFLAPADDKGVSYLKIEHESKSDDMKLWLPNFKKIRRISSRKKSESFMGSDMSYEDMTSREITEYNYKIINNETVNDVECYVLESIPNGIKSEYSRHVSWISKDNYLALKEESYDKSGNLLKEKAIEYQLIKDFHIMKELFVKNVQKNHQTVLEFEDIEINTGIEDKLFHEKNLKRMPK